jgi:hypothetical protein
MMGGATMSTSTRSAAGLVPALTRHAAVTVAAVLWLLGLLIPFISGSKNLLVASPSRSYNMLKFIAYLFGDGQGGVGIAVLIFIVAAPLVLFALLAAANLRSSQRLRVRLAIGAWALTAIDLIFLLAIRAGVDEKATPHLLLGFWLLLIGLLIAALRASAVWLRPRQRGAAPRITSPARL